MLCYTLKKNWVNYIQSCSKNMNDNYNDKKSNKNTSSKGTPTEQREKVKQSDAKGTVEFKDKNGKTLHLMECFRSVNSK